MPNEMQYFSLVTDKGSEKLVQAVHDGKKVNITKFAIGDGNGQAVTPSAEQEALVHEFYKSEIDSYEVSSDDPKQLIIKCVVPGEVGYYVMREWGLFDEDDTLIAVANTADTTLVPAQSGEIFNLDLRAYIQFDNLEFGAVNIVVKSAGEEILKQEILEIVDNKIETSLDPLIKRIEALETTLDGVAEYLESKI